MDLKTIQGELRQLSALVEGWAQTDGIPALERDLALEKLRSLYDKVRFGAVESDAVIADAEDVAVVAEAIDLGDVLSLDPSAGEDEPVSEAAEEEPAEEVAEEVIPEPAIPEPVAEPVAEPEPVVEPASVEPAPVAEPVEEPAPEPVPVSEPEPEPEPITESKPEKPSYVAPTLFGLEEETIRHRNKQRVIMSLYDPAVETPARPEPAPEPAPKPAETPAPVPAETPAPVPVEIPAPEPEAEEPAAVPEEPAEIPETRETSAAPQSAAEEDDDEPGFEEITLEAAAPAGVVLGDVINHDVQTLADTLAAPRDRASELRRSEPVTDLRKAIGINDKFLLIRDLFGGDGEAYERAIGTLNDCADFDDCMIYIAENYAWNPNSDGVKLLMELLERKFA